jgi:peptide-methionine (R)-S-oxide reductase
MEEAVPPAIKASTENQFKSLSELPKKKKYALYEQLNLDNLSIYHKVSCRPITVKAENDMELLSDILTWGEQYLKHWEEGVYNCSRCCQPLYSSTDKYRGPCVWPSFRKPIYSNSISTTVVYPYNSYKVTVKEVYCGKCDLFIGHQFEDAKLKGDNHINAHWRH